MVLGTKLIKGSIQYSDPAGNLFMLFCASGTREVISKCAVLSWVLY